MRSLALSCAAGVLALLLSSAVAIPAALPSYSANLVSPRHPTSNATINCHGSQPMCSIGLCGFKGNCLEQLQSQVAGIADVQAFQDGYNILCIPTSNVLSEGFCLYNEDLHGRSVSGAQVKAAFAKLLDNSCKRCGSGAYDDDASTQPGATLTVNYVHDAIALTCNALHAPCFPGSQLGI